MDLKAQAGHNHVQSGMSGLFTQPLGMEGTELGSVCWEGMCVCLSVSVCPSLGLVPGKCEGVGNKQSQRALCIGQEEKARFETFKCWVKSLFLAFSRQWLPSEIDISGSDK